MKKKETVLLLTALFVLAVMGTILFYFFVAIERVNVYDMELKVSTPGHMAFNVGTDKVYFSKIPPGQTGQRTLMVAGDDNRDVYVKFEADGELAEWVAIEDNFFVIQKNTTRNLTIVARVPENATPGTNVTGKLRGTFFRIW